MARSLRRAGGFSKKIPHRRTIRRLTAINADHEVDNVVGRRGLFFTGVAASSRQIAPIH
jgi:hypothetical protein